SIHIPPSPIRFASPRFSRDWITDASWPGESITSSHSSATGSTHVISCGSAWTGGQLITTPATAALLPEDEVLEARHVLDLRPRVHRRGDELRARVRARRYVEVLGVLLVRAADLGEGLLGSG